MFFFIQNPWVLLGLAGTVVPILLHLQKRRSAKTVRFPSLELLSSIHRTKRISLRVRELLLLLIRTALILFLILGLSGIQFERRGVVTPEILSRQVVPDQIILIDTSYSMGYLESGVSRLDRAVDGVTAIVERRRPGQRFLVLPFSDGVDRLALERAEWTSDTEQILSRIAQLKPVGESTHVIKTLREISELVVDTARCRVWIFSDLQRAGWLEALQTLRQDAPFRDRLPETLIFPVGESETKNFWLEFPERGFFRFLAKGEGVPLPLIACSEGYSQDEALSGTLQLEGQLRLADKDVIPCSAYDRRLQIQGDEQRRIEVPLVPLGDLPATPESSGIGKPVFAAWNGQGTFEMDSGAEDLNRLDFDNSIAWSVPVLWSVPVALIRTEVATVASRVLEACLAPLSDENQFFVKMTELDAPSVSLEALDAFAVAVLQEDAWGTMPETAQESLLRYVREGGGLIAFTSEKESFGLVEQASASAESFEASSGAMSLFDATWSHPALMSLESFGAESLSGALVYRGARLDGLDQVWIMCRHASSADSSASEMPSGPMPVFGEKKYGRGTIIFSGVGLDGEKSDLASSVVFLPLIHQAIKYLVSDDVPEAVDKQAFSGRRTESLLESLSQRERRQLTEDAGLLILESGVSLMGRRRKDLTLPLLMLVLGLALVELWIGNRQV